VNENLMRIIKNNRISLYKLSMETGLPYTTLCRLKQGIMDINKCSCEVLYRLALFFDCNMEELLNPIQYLSNIKGTYRGYNYSWKAEKDKDIFVVKKGNETIITDYDNAMTNRKYYKSLKAFAEMEIDAYIMKKEADELCRNIV